MGVSTFLKLYKWCQIAESKTIHSKLIIVCLVIGSDRSRFSPYYYSRRRTSVRFGTKPDEAQFLSSGHRGTLQRQQYRDTQHKNIQADWKRK